jgi:hypothetical protein
VNAAATLADLSEGASCEACHSEAHGGFAGHDEAMPLELHAASGFPLDVPHNDVGCVECHLTSRGNEGLPFDERFPQRSADDCRTCHGDPHEGQFAAGAFAQAECLTCHDRHAFTPSAFGLELHAESTFPLEGSHQAVACSLCHEQPDASRPPRLSGVPGNCEGCHADAHRGAFVEAAARFPVEAARGCAHCHQPTLFSEFDQETFDHGAWTAFALEGAHERAECEACHERSSVPDETGRTFGVIAALFGEPAESCATCHPDPHGGRFDQPGLPLAVAGLEGCERCHTSEDFATLRSEPFEHERWTGYPMAEFHAQVECAQCHVPSSAPDRFGRTFGRAGTACADCHEDPHVGQFALEGTTDCARCHQDAGALLFDHQLDSRFPLDEQHAAVECSACHVPWPLPGGGEAVRYKPLGTECVDCHDPEFVERERRNTDVRLRGEGGFSPRSGGRGK